MTGGSTLFGVMETVVKGADTAVMRIEIMVIEFKAMVRGILTPLSVMGTVVVRTSSQFRGYSAELTEYSAASMGNLAGFTGHDTSVESNVLDIRSYKAIFENTKGRTP